MSDADDSDEIDAIREQKREQLKQQLESTAADEPIHVESGDHFEELTGDGVVLVDFYADWCGPCKMLEPIVEEVAAETAATVAKVDIDQHQPLARQYNVQGVPTMHLFVDGEPTEQLVGVQDKETLTSLVGRYT
jgi:thioredoxin 1